MSKLDLDNVEQIAHGDKFFIKSILSVFVSESDNYWQAVVDTFKGDIEEFRKAIHKAKSAASNIATNDFVEQLYHVEMEAEKENWPTKKLLDGLKKTWDELVVDARQHVGEEA